MQTRTIENHPLIHPWTKRRSNPNQGEDPDEGNNNKQEEKKKEKEEDDDVASQVAANPRPLIQFYGRPRLLLLPLH
uniref:Uncharacterized protein n=1 Tax=Oryza barthii TaxID=65489 RepID=A0A0D3GAZ8_9ORYZ